MSLESKKSKSDTDTNEFPNPLEQKTLTFIWTLNVSQSIEVNNKRFDFEPQKRYELADEFIKNEWFESAITKGYLKSVS
jgi:hypothetical protein